MNKTILNSKKNRFSENAWKRLNEIYSLENALQYGKNFGTTGGKN